MENGQLKMWTFWFHFVIGAICSFEAWCNSGVQIECVVICIFICVCVCSRILYFAGWRNSGGSGKLNVWAWEASWLGAHPGREKRRRAFYIFTFLSSWWWFDNELFVLHSYTSFLSVWWSTDFSDRGLFKNLEQKILKECLSENFPSKHNFKIHYK